MVPPHQVVGDTTSESEPEPCAAEIYLGVAGESKGSTTASGSEVDLDGGGKNAHVALSGGGQGGGDEAQDGGTSDNPADSSDAAEISEGAVSDVPIDHSSPTKPMRREEMIHHSLYPESNLPCKTGILIPMMLQERRDRLLHNYVPEFLEYTHEAQHQQIGASRTGDVLHVEKLRGSGDAPDQQGQDSAGVVKSEASLFHQYQTNVMEEVVKHENERLAFPDKAMNRVVYDAVDASPFYKKEKAGKIKSAEQPDTSVPGSRSATTGAAAVGSITTERIAGESDKEDASTGNKPPGEPSAGHEQTQDAGTAVPSVHPIRQTPGPHPSSSSGAGRRVGCVTHELDPFYRLTSDTDSTLVFESRFEGGNLRRVVQVSETEYDLVLNPDYNTMSHAQWFYFRVTNTRKDVDYRLNLINMVKPTSLYNEGMCPLVYSVRDAEERGVGWIRGGRDCAYYQNGIAKRRGVYYTLTFRIQFNHEKDTVYIAQCYPYSYSDLQWDLQEIEEASRERNCFRRRKLCETLAANACDLVTITNFNIDSSSDLRNRFGVVITARVHPGETSASWVMLGILKFLTGPSEEASKLREKFVFKLIPMLNPDGVIVGNYRCSLAGLDLNRRWQEPSRKLSPTIFFTKNLIKRLLEDRDIALFLDIHGHSRKKNIFMYGNMPKEQEFGVERLFPKLLSQRSDYFSFDDCNFKRVKESTARCVVYKEFGIANSFTLEASFCGANIGKLKNAHFNTKHLEDIGRDLCVTLLDYENQSKLTLLAKELAQSGNTVNCDSDDNSDEGPVLSETEMNASPPLFLGRTSGHTGTTPAGKIGNGTSHLATAAEEGAAVIRHTPVKKKKSSAGADGSTRRSAHKGSTGKKDKHFITKQGTRSAGITPPLAEER
ncbi:unnamed protein product [Amoebophrya sp. A25]|nr:unnamed protein product [Amoebophrya sp. A25]|eukprot:GSA25T00017645001.1